MNNTTTNISRTYSEITRKGNLHDFTVNEQYNIGTAKFEYTGNLYYWDASEGDFTYYDANDNKSELELEFPAYVYNSDLASTNDGYVMVPTQVEITYDDSDLVTYNRTYNFKLSDESTGLYHYYSQLSQNDEVIWNITNFTISTSNTGDPDVVSSSDPNFVPYSIQDDLANEMLNPGNSSSIEIQSINEIYSLTGDDTIDNLEIITGINNQNSTIYYSMTTSSTPMQKELDDLGIDYKLFNSISISNTAEGIYYKAIESNPEDTIDKMVLFADEKGNTGYNLPSKNAWAPFGATPTLYSYDEYGTIFELTQFDWEWMGLNATFGSSFPKASSDILKFEMLSPDDVRELTPEELYIYSQIIHSKFKYMQSGVITDSSLSKLVNDLAQVELNDDEYYDFFSNNIGTSKINNLYTEYYIDWKVGASESIYIMPGGATTFSWMKSAIPVTCTIYNWTGTLSVVNPEYLKNSELGQKYTLPKELFVDFVPFQAYYNHEYGKNATTSNITEKDIINWFNLLTYDQYHFWIDPNSIDGFENNGIYNKPSQGIYGIKYPYCDSFFTPSDWKAIDDKYIIECNGYDLLIWGCGITPDFIYPMADLARPTPNASEECLLYLNEVGFNSIQLSFANSQTEQFLACDFPSNLNANQQQDLLKKINEFAASVMVYPSNIPAAYFANDTSNILNGSAYRIAYIPDLISSISIITIVLCTFIGLLALIICAVVIKRYIENNRVNIGIMISNGIPKWKIAFSMLPFAMIPAAVGGVAGYVLGLILQMFALSMFSAYWMLPTTLISFSLFSLLGLIIFAFVIFFGICFGVSYWVLRTKPTELMKPGSEFKTNTFSKAVKKPFSKFGIMTRFRVSLAFNSLWKLAILSIMSMLTMSALVFTMTSAGKLTQAQQISASQTNYGYSIQLETPTNSGGPYNAINMRDEFGVVNSQTYNYNLYWQNDVTASWPIAESQDWSYKLNKYYYSKGGMTGLSPASKVDGLVEALNYNGNNYGTLFLPNANDAIGQNVDLMYLQNKVSTQLMLDNTMGVGSLSSNPWDIALSLMPTNYRNLSNESYKKAINIAGYKIYHCNASTFSEYLPFVSSNYLVETDNGYAINKDTIKTPYNLQPDFIKLLEVMYCDKDILSNEFSIHYSSLPLMLSTGNLSDDWNYYNKKWKDFDNKIINENDEVVFKQAITNQDLIDNGYAPIKSDETYTYAKAIIQSPKDKTNSPKTIDGIQYDSQFIDLTDKNGNALNDLLFDEYGNAIAFDIDGNQIIMDKDAQAKTYPIIVNNYAQYKYNFEVGDQITFEFINTSDRFLKPETTKHSATFEIVGISEGAQGEKYYTSQYVINEILGLSNYDTWNQLHKYYLWDEMWNGKYNPSNESSFSVIDLASWENDHYDIYSYDTTTKTMTLEQTTGSFHNESIPVSFNGIYTDQTNGGAITSCLSLYSYTGLYPAASVYGDVNDLNNKFINLLADKNNLMLANYITGINDPVYEQTNIDYLNGNISYSGQNGYRQYLEEFTSKIIDLYGDTTSYTALTGMIDVNSMNLVYENLMSTITVTESSILAVILPMTLFIILIISSLIINDSKKLAAMLKSLGYSDKKNAMSFLAIYIPVILLGLLLSIPLSIGLTLWYQAMIFSSAGILINMSIQWWYFVVSIGGIGLVLLVSYVLGYVSLRRGRLVDQIK